MVCESEIAGSLSMSNADEPSKTGGQCDSAVAWADADTQSKLQCDHLGMVLPTVEVASVAATAEIEAAMIAVAMIEAGVGASALDAVAEGEVSAVAVVAMDLRAEVVSEADRHQDPDHQGATAEIEAAAADIQEIDPTAADATMTDLVAVVTANPWVIVTNETTIASARTMAEGDTTSHVHDDGTEQPPMDASVWFVSGGISLALMHCSSSELFVV